MSRVFGANFSLSFANANARASLAVSGLVTLFDLLTRSRFFFFFFFLLLFFFFFFFLLLLFFFLLLLFFFFFFFSSSSSLSPF